MSIRVKWKKVRADFSGNIYFLTKGESKRFAFFILLVNAVKGNSYGSPH